ncbi:MULTISPECIES: Aspartate/ornithine carbamoyltransferase [Rhizobium]|uniref:Ornithine carbamoyltransferase n=1 Tax=Rhizobium tropici TaxID=398 RepID=A0A6P1C0S0_RHITR|nr:MULTISPECIES: Aspartate/ornithine carbamoyltransferase [Rhizobium]AGB72801.1 putative Aspartate/ornithine carbamoyltransferase family protein [Rhizobium tropici CIAT 899]MBB6491422.1 ornithine carbamoyltransferase [Rhizobium tropici]NEV10528.1 ornithine carbamoyltransferase [Rhizobium tropici]TGE95071.1 ornithine carbamoyltransferase [Rhizobium sp. SEMIA 4088]
MPDRFGKSFLEFHDLPADTILSLLKRAGILAAAFTERRMPQSLQGKRIALTADDSGWRNTTAFNLGIQSMGGICVPAPIGFNAREETVDLAGYLENWFDILVVRTKLLSALHTLAASTQMPVVNARTKANHPCETLGDLAYIRSRRGRVDDLRIAVVAPEANILCSWVEASIALPIKVMQVYPEQWHFRNSDLLNANFSVDTDMRALLEADVIITDSWPTEASPAELSDYRISDAFLDRCRPDAIFLPCPPVARGQEVTADAMTHPLCQSKTAKAFLLHAQNALLEWIVT